jgi:hypothetical protein
MTKIKHHHNAHSTHRPQPHEVHKTAAWAIIATIGVIGIFSAIVTVYTIQNSRPEVIPYSKTPAVGQTVSTNLYSVSVRGVRFTQEADPAFRPPADQQVMIVALAVENKSDKPFAFAPSTMTFIRDDAGDQFVMAPSMLMNDPILGGEIGARQSRGGELSFRVPKDLATATNLKFYFDPRWGEMQPLVFDLN